jgi:hypothetical protein
MSSWKIAPGYQGAADLPRLAATTSGDAVNACVAFNRPVPLKDQRQAMIEGIMAELNQDATVIQARLILTQRQERAATLRAQIAAAEARLKELADQRKDPALLESATLVEDLAAIDTATTATQAAIAAGRSAVTVVQGHADSARVNFDFAVAAAAKQIVEVRHKAVLARRRDVGAELLKVCEPVLNDWLTVEADLLALGGADQVAAYNVTRNV